jgi:hypothetical protein
MALFVCESTELYTDKRIIAVMLRREELLQSLMIVNHCVVGASFLLPPLQGDEVTL